MRPHRPPLPITFWNSLRLCRCRADLDGADLGVRHGRAVGAYDCHVFADEAQQSRYIADVKLALDKCLAYHRRLHPHKW